MNQKRSSALRLGDEFDGAGAHIADRFCGRDRGGAHLLAQSCRHARRRRFLDHLLVPALQRTIAFVQMNRIAVAVGKDLELDMAGRRDVFLDQHTIVGKGGARLALGARQRSLEVRALVDPAQPFPPPPATALISTG